MRTRTKLRCLSVLQTLLAIVVFPLFFFVADWLSAQTPSELREEDGTLVPEHWRAVTVSGGKCTEWSYGTVRENPLSFAFWAGLLFTVLALLLVSAIYAGRLRASDPAERPAGSSGPVDACT